MLTTFLSEAKSITKLVDDMRAVVNDVAGIKPGDGRYSYIEELFDDFVVYGVDEGAEKIYHRVTYTVDAAGAITMGTPVAVQKVTTYPLPDQTITPSVSSPAPIAESAKSAAGTAQPFVGGQPGASGPIPFTEGGEEVDFDETSNLIAAEEDKS